MMAEETDEEGYPSERKATPPVLIDPNEEDDSDRPMPERRQHKYTTANLQPERPWKRYFLICLAFLLVIGIMVLLSIFLQKLFNPPEDEDWSVDNDVQNTADDDALQGGVVNGLPPLLPKSGEYLNDVCSEDRLGGDDTSRGACAQACAPAIDCCNPFATGNSTCFEEQLAGCVTYSQCHALDGFNDPPHNDLDRICSKEEIDINPAPCEQACQSLKCCYTDIDSCVAISFQACLDYAPCQNLKTVTDGTSEEDGNNQHIAAAPASLDEKCRTGNLVCVRECKDGAACNDPQSTFFRDNFVACLSYATCNLHEDATTTRIKVAPIYSRVTEEPENLQRVCRESYVNSTGVEECQQACEPSKCCFDDGSANCFGDDPLGCMSYRMCSILQERR